MNKKQIGTIIIIAIISMIISAWFGYNIEKLVVEKNLNYLMYSIISCIVLYILTTIIKKL